MVRGSGKKLEMLKCAIATRESTTWIKRMVTGSFSGNQEISTEVAIKMMKETVTERCFGLTGQFTKDNGNREFNMDRAK
jgi:hypothetical protein